jgi:cytochrome c oxidase cbb3-type subunit 4
MDAGILRGIFTIVMMLLFFAICIWAYSGKRRSEFESAANLPLETDDALNEKPMQKSPPTTGAET